MFYHLANYLEKKLDITQMIMNDSVNSRRINIGVLVHQQISQFGHLHQCFLGERFTNNTKFAQVKSNSRIFNRAPARNSR